MTTRTHASAGPGITPSLAAFTDAATALRKAALRLDSWLAARKRVSDDHDALARMSDRELIDIGLDRGSVNFVGSGGRVRDDPF